MDFFLEYIFNFKKSKTSQLTSTNLRKISEHLKNFMQHLYKLAIMNANIRVLNREQFAVWIVSIGGTENWSERAWKPNDHHGQHAKV